MSESVAAEHDYISLSGFPTMEATTISDKTKTRDNKDEEDGLNFKATELRLGLPGSFSPERVEARFSSLNKNCCPMTGTKRVYFDAINRSNKWVFSSGSTTATADIGSGSDPTVKDGKPTPFPKPAVPVKEKKNSAAVAAPASKAQVVGWPPIRSFRKNTMASSSSQSQKPGGDSETESGPEACLYVKVSMEGAPYLRKIDLTIYKSYLQLSCALENMFTCFTIGSEYVVTYEDKDSDWMLVGDVPWEMFIGSCKKLRIMKGSEANGLAPRVMEKCRGRN